MNLHEIPAYKQRTIMRVKVVRVLSYMTLSKSFFFLRLNLNIWQLDYLQKHNTFHWFSDLTSGGRSKLSLGLDPLHVLVYLDESTQPTSVEGRITAGWVHSHLRLIASPVNVSGIRQTTQIANICINGLASYAFFCTSLSLASKVCRRRLRVWQECQYFGL